jgi:hypothetical protein
VEGNPAAVGDAAEEFPQVDLPVAAEKLIDVERNARGVVHGREQVLDRGSRGRAQAQRGSLDPVVREHRSILSGGRLTGVNRSGIYSLLARLAAVRGDVDQGGQW